MGKVGLGWPEALIIVALVACAAGLVILIV